MLGKILIDFQKKKQDCLASLFIDGFFWFSDMTSLLLSGWSLSYQIFIITNFYYIFRHFAILHLNSHNSRIFCFGCNFFVYWYFLPKFGREGDLLMLFDAISLDLWFQNTLHGRSDLWPGTREHDQISGLKGISS